MSKQQHQICVLTNTVSSLKSELLQLCHQLRQQNKCPTPQCRQPMQPSHEPTPPPPAMVVVIIMFIRLSVLVAVIAVEVLTMVQMAIVAFPFMLLLVGMTTVASVPNGNVIRDIKASDNGGNGLGMVVPMVVVVLAM